MGGKQAQNRGFWLFGPTTRNNVVKSAWPVIEAQPAGVLSLGNESCADCFPKPIQVAFAVTSYVCSKVSVPFADTF